MKFATLTSALDGSEIKVRSELVTVFYEVSDDDSEGGSLVYTTSDTEEEHAIHVHETVQEIESLLSHVMEENIHKQIEIQLSLMQAMQSPRRNDNERSSR